MRSADWFSSNPLAHDPTTRHTPSGFCPCRACRTTGLPNPMQSTTRRAVMGPRAGAPATASAIAAAAAAGPKRGAGDTSSHAPSGCTSMPLSAAYSITTPPFFLKFSIANSSSSAGFTPVLRMSRVIRGGLVLPWKPQRMGLNSSWMHCSNCCSVRTLRATSVFSSGREMFHSCSRPFSAPRSTTHTRCPLAWSAAAARMPSVPPHTTAS
mmetsp:Transcript_37863/g.93773  ORF Transcript_37863/g.93773 Transcript_37863/m.93773 type:complete len:210 (+) Transcript_37863:1305-1934(+)